MKKILPALILLAIVFPAVVLAQPLNACQLSHDLSFIHPNCYENMSVGDPNVPGYYLGTDEWGVCCAFNAIFTIIDWAFFLLLAVAILLVLIGAYNLITAGGSPEKVTMGRNYILYAIVGFAIALLAKAVPGIARGLIGA